MTVGSSVTSATGIIWDYVPKESIFPRMVYDVSSAAVRVSRHPESGGPFAASCPEACQQRAFRPIVACIIHVSPAKLIIKLLYTVGRRLQHRDLRQLTRRSAHRCGVVRTLGDSIFRWSVYACSGKMLTQGERAP